MAKNAAAYVGGYAWREQECSVVIQQNAHLKNMLLKEPPCVCVYSVLVCGDVPGGVVGG